jgi:hypothetical protein
VVCVFVCCAGAPGCTFAVVGPIGALKIFTNFSSTSPGCEIFLRGLVVLWCNGEGGG